MRQRIIWLLVAISSVASVVAAIRWSLLHPLPLYWDEANYINQSIIDHRLFQSGGVIRLLKQLLFSDPERPPAYRAIAVGATLFSTPTLLKLRMVSLALSVTAMVVLWNGMRAVSSPVNAAVAAAAVFSMPGILFGAAWYGTEFPLYLAIALLIDSLLRERPFELALAIAIGSLAKTTFFLIGVPTIFTATFVDRKPRLFFYAIAGSLIAAPWWAIRWRSALEYARYGATGARWAVTRGLADRAVTFVGGFGILTFVASLLLLEPSWRAWRTQRRAILISLAGSLPLPMAAAISPVFVARHFAPAFLPLAVLLAIGASVSHWRENVALALVCVQTISLAAFVSVLFPSSEPIDWSWLRSTISKRKPVISFIGLLPGLSPPEIRYAWLREGDDADVSWLWAPENQRIDWPRVMDLALTSDIVLVVPPFEVTQMSEIDQRDNVFNGELITRLEASNAFEAPQVKELGHSRQHLFIFERKQGLPATAARPPTR